MFHVPDCVQREALPVVFGHDIPSCSWMTHIPCEFHEKTTSVQEGVKYIWKMTKKKQQTIQLNLDNWWNVVSGRLHCLDRFRKVWMALRKSDSRHCKVCWAAGSMDCPYLIFWFSQHLLQTLPEQEHRWICFSLAWNSGQNTGERKSARFRVRCAGPALASVFLKCYDCAGFPNGTTKKIFSDGSEEAWLTEIGNTKPNPIQSFKDIQRDFCNRHFPTSIIFCWMILHWLSHKLILGMRRFVLQMGRSSRHLRSEKLRSSAWRTETCWCQISFLRV